MWTPLLFPYSIIPPTNDLPPTIQSILNSYCNFGKDDSDKVLAPNLANAGRGAIFDFNYPISEDIKQNFETNILNHFLMRRIGYDTVTAFKIALNVKLNEIMPNYNKLYDAIRDWNIFDTGEIVTRGTITNDESNSHQTQDLSSNTTTNSSTEMRHSDTPQSNVGQVQSASYISDYDYNTDNGKGTSNSSNTQQQDATGKTEVNETIDRTYKDKMDLYNKFIEKRQNLYTMIYNDLDELFYQIAE